MKRLQIEAYKFNLTYFPKKSICILDNLQSSIDEES